MVRRVIKAEFGIITKEEVTVYLDQLEQLLFVHFTAEARNELFALCTDAENGGLGIFISLLELMFTIIRPEWKEICISKRDGKASPYKELKVIDINREILKQVSRFKMTK